MIVGREAEKPKAEAEALSSLIDKYYALLIPT